MIVDASTFQFRRSLVVVVVVVVDCGFIVVVVNYYFVAIFGRRSCSSVGRQVRRSGGKVAAHIIIIMADVSQRESLDWRS